jgi:hypothetical protein
VQINSNKLGGAIRPFVFIMRYLFIILLLFLAGCASSLKFYPEGNMMGHGGMAYAYYWGNAVCHKCRKPTTTFKIDNKNRKICWRCYEKYYK